MNILCQLENECIDKMKTIYFHTTSTSMNVLSLPVLFDDVSVFSVRSTVTSWISKDIFENEVTLNRRNLGFDSS